MRKTFNFFLILVAAFTITRSPAQIPTVQGSTTVKGTFQSPQINSDYFVGQVSGFYATIQSAVTKACTTSGARVVIPAGFTPSDSIQTVTGGCATVGIIDNRATPTASYAWTGSAYVFAGGSGGSGSGSVIPSPQFQKTFFPNAGSIAAVMGDNGSTTDGAGHETAVSLLSTNPLFGLGMGAHIDVAADYTQRNTLGNVTNQPFPLERPWTMTQTVNRRFGPAQGTNPFTATLFLLSGLDNTDIILGNYGIMGLSSFSLTPQQGGGMFSINGQCHAVGDCVGDTMVLTGRGVSRGEDEGTEKDRIFLANDNDVAGGTLTAVSTDAQGANPIKTSQITNIYSQNFYEKAFVMDLTRKFQSPGNIASIGTATDDRFEFFQGDATSGITAQVGVSTQTLLTAPIDSFVYTGACGSQTKTAATYPISGQTTGANDGFMTDYRGIGTPGENTNYGATGTSIVGFCATVASTAGMAPGTLIFIADGDYAFEYTRVISVADATHFTAFMRSAHFTGATVNFGGGVGSCIGADVDIIPIGQNSTANNDQYAPQHLCYPIVQSLAGDKVNVYTNIEGSDQNNLNTLLPSANTPKVPLTITSPVVVGGVLTGFTANDTIGNANNYTANNLGTANSGHPRTLPVPTVVVNGCTVPPTLKFTPVNANVGVTFSPSIVNGGSGCGTVTFTIQQSYPTPFGIFPVAAVYKSEDPTLPPGPTAPANNKLTNGNPVLMPFNTSAMLPGDTLAEGEWWNGRNVSAQDNYLGNPLSSLDGRQGPTILHRLSSVRQAYEVYLNTEQTSHYFGSFANNYAPVSTSDFLLTPPAWQRVDGQFGIDLQLSFPPILPSGDVLAGGSIITVTCQRDLSALNIDPPCEHGIDLPYNLFNGNIGIGHTLSIYANHTAGIIGVGGGALTFQAPTITAYQTGVAAPDVALLGLTYSGPQAGPCMRYDLLLTSAPHAVGQSYSRICGFLDQSGSTLGDLSFQTVNAGGTTYATPLLLNANGAKFSVPISSTVANGTAPISVVSTTVVPNLNVTMVNGVQISGTPATGKVPVATGASTATWQTLPGIVVAGTPASGQIPVATGPTTAIWQTFAPTTTGFTGNFNMTTTVGTCGFSYTNGLLMTKTGSC